MYGIKFSGKPEKYLLICSEVRPGGVHAYSGVSSGTQPESSSERTPCCRVEFVVDWEAVLWLRCMEPLE